MSIFDPLLDLVFPRFCIGCGVYGTYLCGSCAKQIRFYSLPLCPGCMASIDHLEVHRKCWKKTSLDGLVVVASFSGVIKEMIVGIKYHGWFAQSKRLSEIVYRVLLKKYPHLMEEIHPRVMIPVPLHPLRLDERGFNQSELFAQHISRLTGIPMRSTILHKMRQTIPQASLSRAERLKNNSEIYRCTIRLKKSDTILLVDDVVTTGATLSACAEALKKAGAGKIYALAIAHGH